MTIKKFHIIALSCVLSANALAGRMDTGYRSSGWPFVVTFNLGPAWSRPGETHTLNLQPEVFKTYTAPHAGRAFRLISTPKGTQTLGTGELFLGLYGPINSVVEGQLGIAIAAYSQVKLTGQIYEDANPSFNNYNFTYKVRSTRIALKGKSLFNPHYYDLLPYLSGSVGVGDNHTSSFSVKPVLNEEVVAPRFTDQTNTAFSYTIGIGVELALDFDWRLNIGYEYAGWGMSRLGRAPAQTIGRGLHLDNIRTHELQLGFSYMN